MAAYRFLFAPVLLLVAALTGPPHPRGPPRTPPAAVQAAPASAAAVQPAGAESPAGVRAARRTR